MSALALQRNGPTFKLTLFQSGIRRSAARSALMAGWACSWAFSCRFLLASHASSPNTATSTALPLEGSACQQLADARQHANVARQASIMPAIACGRLSIELLMFAAAGLGVVLAAFAAARRCCQRW